MPLTDLRRIAAAAGVAFGVAVLAEATGQTQSPSQAAQPGSAAVQKVAVVGCVQRESDYRKMQDAGRGGVAGTGVGVGNEFVLTNASTAGNAGVPASSGQPASSSAYELTGKNEGLAAKHVGRRVEISGVLKAAAERGASGAPKLREIELESISEIGGTCPAM